LAKSLRSSDLLRRRTEDYRAALAEDKDRAAQLKKKFQGFLPAAIVSEKRARKYVTSLTGLVMCDFDHVPQDRLAEIRTKVNADPHTVLSYVTLSGEGLRVLAGYEPDSTVSPNEGFALTPAERYYQKMFTGINQYYARLIGCNFDPACKDLSRLSFVAFDEETFFHPEARTFTTEEASVITEAKRKEMKAEKRQQNKALHLISQIYRRSIKPLLASEGTVFGPGTHNNYVMRTGYMLNKFGFELEDAKAWAQKEFAEYAEAAEVVGRCYARTEEHGEMRGQVQATLCAAGGRMQNASRLEILQFLLKKADVRYNLITGYTEMRWKNPTYAGVASKHSHDRHTFTHDIDRMVNTLTGMIEEELNLYATKEKVFEVIESDRIPEFDALVDHLHRLPGWNPETDPDYLGELADTVRIIDTDPDAADLWKRCLKKWFVGMLVGWVRPGKVNESILHFIGAQGTFKTTWMTHLMPPELREYFKIKQNSGDLRTDDIISMSRYGLILHEETDVMNARENNTLKAITTAKYSDERAPYGRAPKRRNNIASLCATGNSEQFLTNDQGTRRMLVFRVEVVKPHIDYPFNYEGIYAQAYYLMNHGFQYYFDGEEQAELERHNLQFETVNMEEEAVALWLRAPQSWETPRWMRPGQVAELLSSRSHCHARYNPNKIGRVMHRLGFQTKVRNGNVGYNVMVRDYDEAVRFQKELAMAKAKAEAEEKPQESVCDISEAPQSVQDSYSRLLGEKTDE
jgi:hypothetical protein